MNRRLYRCRHDRRIAGVAAGVAEFFDLDPTLVRVLWFFSIFFGGVTLVLYLGLWAIMPLEPLSAVDAAAAANAPEPEGHHHRGTGSGRLMTFFGIALVLFGSLALLDVLLPSLVSWRYLWPIFLLTFGVVLIAGSVRRDGAQAPLAAPPATSADAQEPTNP
jgi:phage shock protein PspC (stress-responsive transcriptional regulator)